jgi:hypothetical protein
MMRNRILFSVLLALFTACNYQSFTATESEKPKVAVSSFFSPDSVIRVKVTPVADAFTDSSKTLDVKEIKVTNQKTGQIAYLEKEDSSESVYTTAQLIPVLGDVFKLEVLTSASDEPIVAVDSICATVTPFRLASAGVDVDDRSRGNTIECYINRTGVIRFLPVGSEDLQYYELNVYVENIAEDLPDSFWREHRVTLTSSTSIVTSEDYYPSKTAIASYNPHALLFKCNSGNDSVSVDFVYGSIMIGSSAGWKSCAHNLRIELRRVSYAYYKFATAWAKQENAMIGDILYGGAPPVLIPSNVENGTGVFAGYNATEYKTFIEKYIYEKQY